MTWWVLGIALTVVHLFNQQIGLRSPLVGATYVGEYLSFFLFMFPIDLNVTNFLGIKINGFVGEWFMGAIIWLYLISPFLYTCAKKFPIPALLISIAISCLTFYAAEDLMLQGRIHAN